MHIQVTHWFAKTMDKYINEPASLNHELFARLKLIKSYYLFKGEGRMRRIEAKLVKTVFFFKRLISWNEIRWWSTRLASIWFSARKCSARWLRGRHAGRGSSQFNWEEETGGKWNAETAFYLNNNNNNDNSNSNNNNNNNHHHSLSRRECRERLANRSTETMTFQWLGFTTVDIYASVHRIHIYFLRGVIVCGGRPRAITTSSN